VELRRIRSQQHPVPGPLRRPARFFFRATRALRARVPGWGLTQAGGVAKPYSALGGAPAAPLKLLHPHANTVPSLPRHRHPLYCVTPIVGASTPLGGAHYEHAL